MPTVAQFNNFDPTNRANLEAVFAALKKPRNFKQFGQNFLMDRQVRDAIVRAAELQATDSVLEIGPGAGVLTQQLVRKAGRVVALDIDPYLLEATRLACQGAKNLELRLEDVKKINLPALFCPPGAAAAPGNYVAVSNLPYFLTGYILELLSDSPCSPRRMVLMVQREVAERILARAGDHTLLSISLAVYGSARLVTEVPREAFWPEPNVDSSVVCIDRHASPVVPTALKKQFFRVVKAGFSARRKKLANALAGGLRIPIEQAKEAIRQAGLAENARAQELELSNWTELSQKVQRS